MTYETGKMMPFSTEGQKSSSILRGFLVRGFWMVSFATLIIFLLFISQGTIKLSESGQRLVAIFVYSVSIALPSMWFVSLLSVLYTEKLPRMIFAIQTAAFVATASFGCLIAGLILLIVGITHPSAYWMEYKASLPFSIFITLVIGMSVSAYETLRFRLQAATLEARTRQLEQERAYKLLAEARLSSLESRIHPHFLFNTLNSIAALIPTDPRRAEDTIGKLASLLRFSLNAQHSGLVPLAQELKIVRDYLEIESTRFGSRLRYRLLVPEALDSIGVPPLALQTLVENSVKHVAAHRQEGTFIQVAAALQMASELPAGSASEPERIRLEVIDDGPGFSLGAIEPEHGIGNLIARLDLLFGSAGSLDVTREDEKTVVRMSFPVKK